MKPLYGIMRRNVKLLGTILRLFKHEHVILTHATNLPQGGYFARPEYDAGPEWGEDYSIHLDRDDVFIYGKDKELT